MTEPFPVFADFEGKEGECYQVTAEGLAAAAPFTLTSAHTWGCPWAPEARQPFTLHFEGPPEPFLPQGTYHFKHPTMDVDLFIVPLGPTAGRFLYEVVLA